MRTKWFWHCAVRSAPSGERKKRKARLWKGHTEKLRSCQSHGEADGHGGDPAQRHRSPVQPKSIQTKPSNKLNCSPRALPGFQAHEEEMSQAGAASLQSVSLPFGQSEPKINYLFLFGEYFSGYYLTSPLERQLEESSSCNTKKRRIFWSQFLPNKIKLL